MECSLNGIIVLRSIEPKIGLTKFMSVCMFFKVVLPTFSQTLLLGQSNNYFEKENNPDFGHGGLLSKRGSRCKLPFCNTNFYIITTEIGLGAEARQCSKGRGRGCFHPISFKRFPASSLDRFLGNFVP